MRAALVVAALAFVLVGMLALRLRVQTAAARAPPGGSGEIEGTTIDLSARITARIAALHAREGDDVRAGALVLQLDCSDALAAVDEAGARLSAADAQFVAAQAAATSACRAQDAAAAGRDAARAQAAVLATQRASANREAARLDTLVGEVTPQSRDLAHAAADGLRHQELAARAQAAASDKQASAAAQAAEAAAAQALAAGANANAARATLARAQLLAEECEVRAPRDATVGDLPHEPGELVPAGQVLARLVDLDEVKAVFYLPNAELAAARPPSPSPVSGSSAPSAKWFSPSIWVK